MIVIYKSSIEIQNLNLKTLKTKINEINDTLNLQSAHSNHKKNQKELIIWGFNN